MVPEWLGPGLFVMFVPMAFVFALRVLKKAENRRLAVAALAVSAAEVVFLVYRIAVSNLF